MMRFRRLLGGVRALWRGRQADQELDEELRAYLDSSIEEKIRAGMSREAAMRAARAEIGSVEAVKDRIRDVGWETRIESVWRDIRYAVRTLRRSPGFTSAAVLTLALGIGATTAIFSLLDALMLKALPVKNPGELVLVEGSQYPVFQAFREHSDIFADLLATSGITPLDVEIDGSARERTDVSLVSGTYFSTLGVPAALGRVFTVHDDRTPGRHSIAVASDTYWRRRFGRDAAILGRDVRINGTPVTIVGVAPPGFFGEQVGASPDLWVPLTMWGHLVPGRNLLQMPAAGWLRMIGRVQPGVATSGPHPELTATFRQVLAGIFGPKMPQDVQRDLASATITLTPAERGLSPLRTQFGRPLQLLMGAVVVVLLIACANIANLLLARATARRREIDVRLALGMSRGRLLQQLLTECVVLAALGGAAGVVIAWLGRDGLLRLISVEGSGVRLAVATDARLLTFVIAVSSATAFLFGLAPASSSARADLVSSTGVRSDTSRGSHRLGAVMIVAQIALSLVLLMGAGLFSRTLANLRAVDLGFRPERLLIIDIDPQAAGYRGERAVALGGRLLDRLVEVPGVSSVSLSEHGVLAAVANGTDLMRPAGFVAGPDGVPRTRWDVVGPRYFATSGASIAAGRDFSERDDARSPMVVAINETMARLFFAGADPIGRRLVWDVGGVSKAFDIIAVVRDVKRGGREQPPPAFYLSYLQLSAVRPAWAMARMRILVRASGDPSSVASTVRERIRSEEPRLSVASIETGPELVNRTLARERLIATLLVGFGVLAVGLACLGLYGLIAYHVARRRSEIGIRMALGAQRSDVLKAILRQTIVWIGIGVAIGVPLALSASRLVQGLLFGLSPSDLGTLITAVVVMSLTGLLAGYLPARRAARMDPLPALRAE